MRTELQLTLWSFAAGALALAAVHVPSVSLPPEADPSPRLVAALLEDIETSAARDELGRLLPDGPTRPLFRLAAAQSIEAMPVQEPEPPPPEPSEPSPRLKGIIDVDGVPRAVFEAFEEDGSYVVAAVGDPVGSSVVSGISGDIVSVATPTGEIIHLKLRGTGEQTE